METMICPRCHSRSVFTCVDKKHMEVAICRSCFCKKPADLFGWEDIEYWNMVDDWIKEKKIERSLKDR